MSRLIEAEAAMKSVTTPHGRLIDATTKEKVCCRYGEDDEWQDYEMTVDQCFDDTISRSGAIDAILKRCREMIDSKRFGAMSIDRFKVAFSNSIDVLKYLPEAAPTAECSNASNALKTLAWIPVTERLPEEERKSYWVCTDGGYQYECRWTNNIYGIGESEEWGWSIFDIPQYSKVIAWMPLPEPYKG